MVHSEVVTDNVETVLLGFIGWTYCNLCCRMAAAPLPLFTVPSFLLFLLSDLDVAIYRLLFGTSGSSVFHFLLTSNQPVFVFSSHSCVHTTWSENTLLSRLVNMLFLIYYLLPMGCISECPKQLFRFCSHNHVERNHRARCLALVLQHLCFPLSLCKIHPSLFYLFPRIHRLQQLVNSQSTREKKLLLITFDKWQIVLAWLPANA